MSAPTNGYAPASPSRSAQIPRNLPSASSASAPCCTWPRPWGMPMRFSRRVCTHWTGRARRRAVAATTTASGVGSNLPPNPPPTCGARTRTSAGSSPRLSATASRTVWTRCVEAHSTTPSPSGSANAPSGSIGAAAIRWFTKRPLTTTSASPRTDCSSAVASSHTTEADTSSTELVTGSGSTSTTTSSTASTAWAAVSATTTATGSPTKRTVSRASGGRVKRASSIGCPRNGASPRSSPVSTATTPLAARAADGSRRTMWPCATSARTKAAWSFSPGRSGRYRPAPRSSGPSSTVRIAPLRAGAATTPPPAERRRPLELQPDQWSHPRCRSDSGAP